MDHRTAPILQRQQYLILGGLLISSALAWGALIWQSNTMMNSQAMGMTMGMNAFLFITIWIVMMIAMMFPASAPMALTFAAIYEGRKQQNRPFIPTWVFISAYLLVWALCGGGAYVLATLLEHLAAQSMWLMDNTARLSGVVLLIAGLYQLSPLKDICQIGRASCRGRV